MGVDIFSQIREWAPKDLLRLLDQFVHFFPQDTRLSLKRVIDTLPPVPDNLTKVYEMVREQWGDLRGPDQLTIAVVGPGQTGKNGLVRALSRRQAGESVSFEVVDVQGLDEYLGYERQTAVSDQLVAADIVLLVLDAQYGVSDSTVRMYRNLAQSGTNPIVVMNKIDLVDAPREVIKSAGRELKTTILPMSLLDDERIDDLLRGIVAAFPRSLYPLSRAFPGFRKAFGRQIVNEAACAATIAGALRTPFPTFVSSAAVHGAMILKLARAYGLRLNTERARELLPVLALDIAFDRGLEYLKKRFPGRKTLISASLSGAYTFGLGQAAIRYFEWMTDLVDAGRILPGPETILFMEQGLNRENGTRALKIALVITAVFMIVEFLGGLWTNSLALTADAGHMLTDVAALGLSLFAAWFIRRPATPEKTFGYFRVEILAALLNGVFLVGIAVLVFYESYVRFLAPQSIKTKEMVIIGVMGLIANLASASVLHGSHTHNLNIRGAFLHVIGDILGSIAVIGAGIGIAVWGFFWADPAVSALVSVLILLSAWRLVRDSVLILLEGTPAHVNLGAMTKELCEVPGVRSVHDLHVWTLTSGVHVMTCHAVVVPGENVNQILEQLNRVSRQRFRVDHTTIQIEDPNICRGTNEMCRREGER